MRARLAILAGLLVCLGGCDGGGGGTGGGGGMAGMGGQDMTGGSGGTAGTAGSATGGTGGSSGAPLAPTMEGATPMEGVLHVAWTNNTPDCEKIELDRNLDGGAFAVEYTLTGAATSQHDTGAVPPGTYCYKARCIKGAETSPDSNEVCGTP
jgi:hypothetical protein